MILDIPPGQRKGCLPRASRPGELCPMAAEIVNVLPRPEWAQWIGKIRNRIYLRKIKNQGNIGSCACESVTQDVEMMEVLNGRGWVELNPLFIYHHTNGGSDRGSSIDTNLAFVRDQGIAPESVWPRSRGWAATPSYEAYEAAKAHRALEFYDVTTIEQFATCLLYGWPVVFGWQGHSVVATDLVTDLSFDYANSWGANWGAEGFGRLGLASVDFRYGAFALRVVTQEL